MPRELRAGVIGLSDTMIYCVVYDVASFLTLKGWVESLGLHCHSWALAVESRFLVVTTSTKL
jgi:hypothetical protein